MRCRRLKKASNVQRSHAVARAVFARICRIDGTW